MKTLGVIGGIGPESTIDYYKKIIDLYRERRPDGSYPQFVINSIDLQKGIDFLEANDFAGMADFLLAEIQKLPRAGAQFGIIAANTPHVAFDDIAPRSPIPLISIVEAACAAAKARSLRRLALFGTRYTMQANFYQRFFSREGIELLVPEPTDQDYIHDKYFGELLIGKFLPETRAGLLGVVDRMKSKIDIEGVLLAGTELALILSQETHHGLPLLDTGRIHCEAAVAEMLS